MIENGQVWRHTGTGNEFVVLDTNPHTTDSPNTSPPDNSEEYVYVEAPDYETKEAIWLARRLFDSQLSLVEG